MSIWVVVLLAVIFLVWLVFHLLFTEGYSIHRIDKNPTKHTGA